MVNMIGAVAVLGEFTESQFADSVCFDYKWKKQLLTSRDFYEKTGINSYLERVSVENDSLKDEIEALSQHHGRTFDVAAFENHMRNFRTKSEPVLEKATSVGRLHSSRFLKISKQRYKHDVVNSIYAIDEALHEDFDLPRLKAPIIIAGDSTFSGISGKKTVPSSSLISHLAKFFSVIMVDEYNTSQKCPKCWNQLESGKGLRIKKCKNDKCRTFSKEGEEFQFYVNRDVSAPMNMFSIVLHQILIGERPEAFCRGK
jgi:hypothetical protein